MVSEQQGVVKLALPKGRMQDRVFRLLADAGVELQQSSRGYRPRVSLDGFDAKILKPQNALEMLHSGTRDLGFGGADWVRELDVERRWQRAGGPSRPAGPGRRRQLLELGARLAGVQPGRPGRHRRRRTVLLLRD